MTEEIKIGKKDVVACNYWKACDYYKQLKRAEIEIKKLKGVDGSVHPDSAYYKIARLEQENNSLQAQLNNITVQSNNEITALEQENKKLKKDVQLFKCLDTFGESECHCACRCLGNEFCEGADKRINTYRSALEEIRTYLNTLSSIDNDFPNTETYLRIQDKINEVLK